MKRRVLITGTTSGIGHGLMSHYDKEGWQVVAFNRREDKELESRFPGVQFIHTDVRDRERIRAYFREAHQKNELPELYYLNAGINKPDNLGHFSIDPFQEVMDINLTGVLNYLDAAMPYLTGKKAVFVATSSTSNIVPNPNNLGYHISKWAEAKIFKLLNERYKKQGWTFKVLILGPVATRIFVGRVQAFKFQSRVRDFLTLSVESTIPKIVRFVHSPRKVFYYPKKAVFVFLLADLAKKIIPGFYKGSVSPSKGERIP